MERHNLSKDLLIKLYLLMLKIRLFEEAQARVYRLGEQEGFTHLYIGEEAIAAGACLDLNKDDYITSTHRGHGHMIAKGGQLKPMMAELYGRRTGYCKGKGGSLHIADFNIGVLGANGIVAAGIPIAVGAGYSIKLRKTNQVVVCFFGDGATTQGAFHEGINMAAIWNLPVVFIIENNMYLVGTRISRVCKVCDNLSIKAAGYGIPGKSIDGNDAVEVYLTVKDAVENARKGNGPALIECKTFRHHTHFEGDIDTRDKKEIEKWLGKDPVGRMETLLFNENILSKSDMENHRKKINIEIDEAIKFAKESPIPGKEVALEDVYMN